MRSFRWNEQTNWVATDFLAERTHNRTLQFSATRTSHARVRFGQNSSAPEHFTCKLNFHFFLISFLFFDAAFWQSTPFDSEVASKITTFKMTILCSMYLIMVWFANVSKFRILCNIYYEFFICSLFTEKREFDWSTFFCRGNRKTKTNIRTSKFKISLN